jgi:hypothetical protein
VKFNDERQDLVTMQAAVCAAHGAVALEADDADKLGIALNVRSDLLPLNGRRVAPTHGTCGWYIWSGTEPLSDPDFFVPIHVQHVGEWAPMALPFLLLPPGWRFLTDGHVVDVWLDQDLLADDQTPSRDRSNE